MNCNDANLNLVNGSKNQKSLTIKFICKSKVLTHFSLKIEPGNIDEDYMLEQLINLLYESEVLSYPNTQNLQWKDTCRVVYKGSKTFLEKKPRILVLFDGDTLPTVCFVGADVNGSNYFGKTITFKELLRLRNKIRNEKQTTKHKICIEQPNKASGNFDAILKDSNDDKFYLEMPENGCNSKGLPITDSEIFDMMFYLKMLHFGETNNLAYIDSNYIGKTMKYDTLLSLYNQKKRYGRDDISYSACITDVDNWNVEFRDDNDNNNGELILKISREDFSDSSSTWQSVINALVSAGILCSDDIAHFGKTITCKGAYYLKQAIIEMLVDVGILKHKTELQPDSKLYVAPAYNKKTITLKEALQLYDKVISQKQGTQDQKKANGSLQLKIWCSDKIGDGFTVEINQDDIDSESSSQYLENIVNSVALIDSNILKSSLFQILLDTKILSNVSENITLVHNKNFVIDDWNKKSLKQKFNELKCPVNIYTHGSVLSNNEYVGKTIKFNELIGLLTKYKNQNQQNEIIADESKDENGNINHNLNKVVKANSEELKNNDENKVVDNLKETSSQTDSKKTKINETILFSCRKKGIMTESFSLEINCDNIDNNLLFKDFIKELVAKGVFYCSSNKVSDPYKAIYCNGVLASELTVGEVLKLPAVSVQNKFIVGMTWFHINGAYVNKTVKLEDLVKSHVQIESQKQLNKKSLEQPKLESTLLKDYLDEGKKEDEADKNVKDKNSLLIPFRCGSENEQQIFNLELEDDDIKHDYQLQELVKILIDAKILTWSKMNWQFDCHISCQGCNLTDKSVNKALKLFKNKISPFFLLQTQIGSDYNNQTVKLKDVIKLRNKIKTQQQISNEKQDKQDNINIDNSNSNINLLDQHSDKKNKTMSIRVRKEDQNFANLSIEFENGDIDDGCTLKQLLDLLYNTKIFIFKGKGGWKGASYNSHDARELQKSISEAFSSYTTPKITLFESVFYDSSYFNKKMTFKDLIKLRDNIESEELKKQGHLSEKSAQPKIDRTKSEALVNENNLSNLNNACDEQAQITAAFDTEVQKENISETGQLAHAEASYIKPEFGNTNANLNVKYQKSQDKKNENKKSLIVPCVCITNESSQTFNLEIEEEDINNNEQSQELTELINLIGGTGIVRIDQFCSTLINIGVLIGEVEQIQIDKYNDLNTDYDWEQKTLNYKFEKLKNLSQISELKMWGLHINNIYENKTIKFKDVMRLKREYEDKLQAKEKENEDDINKYVKNQYGKPNVVLIFIKNNRRKITISIFSIGAGIVIGAIAGWIFAPILPIVDLVLILLDLKFNFLEPTEVSKGLNVPLNPKENKPLGQNQIATKKPGQENPDPSKSNTLLQ